MDLANACFELVGAYLAWRSVLELRRQRGHVSGIYAPQIAFSALWALWCLPYYTSVAQPISLVCSGLRAAGCLTWTVMAWRYR